MTKRTATTPAQTTVAETIADIARRELRVETLDIQGRDSLDFHDLSVGSIRRALEAAYAAGRASK